MSLPISGVISFRDINVELGKAANSPISLNDTDVRSLAGKSTGIISIRDFHGKSLYIPGLQEWSTPGSHSFIVPNGVSSIVGVSVGGGSGGVGFVRISW